MSSIKKYVKALVLLGLILIVFVTGCGDQSMGGGCSGTQTQGWSGFAPYKNVICFGSMEGKVIALDTSARSENKTFPSEDEWVYVVKAATPGSACGAVCAPSSSSSGLGIYDTPVIIGELAYVGTYTGKIYALNASRGVVRWIYPREGYDTVGAIVGNIVTDGSSLYFGSANGKMDCTCHR
jgi:outer membrane protein assembly factor BamB